VSVGVLLALLRALLAGDSAEAGADSMLAAGQLRLAGGYGISDVLAPNLGVRASGHQSGSQRTACHQSEGDSGEDRNRPRR
jgi:hypothetical protein